LNNQNNPNKQISLNDNLPAPAPKEQTKEEINT
jgi:hypothetical protein